MFSLIYIQSNVTQKPIINPAPNNQVRISSASYPLAMYIVSSMPSCQDQGIVSSLWDFKKSSYQTPTEIFWRNHVLLPP